MVAPSSPARARGAARRTPTARLEEAVSLAAALNLDVVGSGIVTVTKARPATLIGSGKVDEFGGLLRAEEAELAIIDAPLTPVQQRNLERAWKVKVLDRTGLILEIFAARASTREGRLQVELARLTYQRSRLVRTWTHLERQRGGLGFVGGPGETQIEADRRLIQERITALRRELESVRRTRALHRAARARVPYPIVALVGYTNAGKSSLFNRLTDADASAKNLLFATLDPAMRRLSLPHGATAIVSDTVGFVSDLPTHLVAAFRATLEEVTNADLILHVRDISHPDAAAQAGDVETVLALLWGEAPAAPVIEVLNKIDRLDDAARAQLATAANTGGAGSVAVSALTGQGMDRLLAAIEGALGAHATVTEIGVAADRGRDINWVYENCEVLERRNGEAGTVVFRVRVPAARLNQFVRRFASPAAAS
jgi:GTP-binding protein HflX